MNHLTAMALFVDVAKLGSFAAVAAQRGIARSVVTRQIAALESYLGVQLIARTTRNQSLTSAGRLYLERSKVVLDLVEQTESELRQEQLKPKGNLRISLPLSYGLRHLSDVLMQFAQTFPEIHLDLHFNDHVVDVNHEGYDLAIRIVRDLALSDIVRKIGQCQLTIVASPSYLEQHGEPATLSELTQHHCLQYSQHVRWPLYDGEKIVHLNTSGRIRANNGDALAKAAAAGLGIAVIPDFIANDYLKTQQLKQILAHCEQDSIGIYVVLPTNSYIPERVRLLIDYLAQQLAT